MECSKRENREPMLAFNGCIVIDVGVDVHWDYADYGNNEPEIQIWCPLRHMTKRMKKIRNVFYPRQRIKF